MRLLLINPNTSADMTARLAEGARRRLPTGVEITEVTAGFGGEVIASRAAYAIAGHAALECHARASGGFDGVLLACFGDPGLEALQEVSPVPVAGLLDASLEMARRQGRPFGIVTAGPLWRAMLEERIGAQDRPLFCGIEIVEASGLAISRDPQAAVPAIAGACQRLQLAGAELIIPGGASMIEITPFLPPKLPVIDCLSAAVAVLLERCKNTSALRSRDPKSIILTRGLSPELEALLAGA
jgi:allantoin racemase